MRTQGNANIEQDVLKQESNDSDISKFQQARENLEIYVAMVYSLFDNLRLNNKSVSDVNSRYRIVSLLTLVVLLSCIVSIIFVFYMKKRIVNKEGLENKPKEAKLNSNETFNANEVIVLKGRTKRVPKNINYKELFLTNSHINEIANFSTSGSETTNVKNKQSNKKSSNQNETSHEMCSQLTIEDFFERIQYAQTTNVNFNNENVESNTFPTQTSNENLLIFNENPNEVFEAKNIETENQNIGKSNRNSILIPIKEEFEEEEDEHTILVKRLKNNNSMQLTAITNYLALNSRKELK